MGQEASKPEAGRTLQVIGAGLPRSGTASFSEALAILLKGPVYHGGTQVCKGPERHVQGWIDILNRTPIRSDDDRKFIHRKLKSLLDGYVAAVDTPCQLFVEETLELYPDAKVICTVRDPDKWAESFDKLAQTALQSFLPFALFWLPTLRLFPQWAEAVHAGRWNELYGPAQDGKKYAIGGREIWDRHIQHLKRTIPKDKLVFLDVRDGWEPLCKALDVPVPVGVKFPRINDSDAMETFAKKQVMRGLMRWALVFGSSAVLIGGGVMYWKRQ